MVRVAAFVWAAAAIFQNAQAGESAALYDAYWAGIPAGEIRLTLRDDAAAYKDEIVIRTAGLARLLTRFRGSAVSEGHFAAERLPAPVRYDAAYDLRKARDRHLSMKFAPRAAGALVAERGALDTSKKPPLAEPFRTNVLDPLSALAAIRLCISR